jgi:hypothetical protein
MILAVLGEAACCRVEIAAIERLIELFGDAPIGLGNVHAYVPNSDLESNIVATRHKQCYTLLLWPKHHEP